MIIAIALAASAVLVLPLTTSASDIHSDADELTEFLNKNIKDVDADFGSIEKSFEELGKDGKQKFWAEIKVSGTKLKGTVKFNVAQWAMYPKWQLSGDVNYSNDDKSAGTVTATLTPDADNGKLSVDGMYKWGMTTTACVRYTQGSGEMDSVCKVDPTKERANMKETCADILKKFPGYAKDVGDCIRKYDNKEPLPLLPGKGGGSTGFGPKSGMPKDRNSPPPPGAELAQASFEVSRIDDGIVQFNVDTVLNDKTFKKIRPPLYYDNTAAVKATLEIPEGSLSTDKSARGRIQQTTFKTSSESNIKQWAKVTLTRDAKMKPAKGCSAEAKITTLKYKIDMNFDQAGEKPRLSYGEGCSAGGVTFLDADGNDLKQTLEKEGNCIYVARQLAIAVCTGLGKKVAEKAKEELKDTIIHPKH